MDGADVNTYGTNPLKRDTDKDDGNGLTDGQEAGAAGYGTNPLNSDTDNGGASDGTELGRGSDPLNADDD